MTQPFKKAPQSLKQKQTIDNNFHRQLEVDRIHEGITSRGFKPKYLKNYFDENTYLTKAEKADEILNAASLSGYHKMISPLLQDHMKDFRISQLGNGLRNAVIGGHPKIVSTIGKHLDANQRSSLKSDILNLLHEARLIRNEEKSYGSGFLSERNAVVQLLKAMS